MKEAEGVPVEQLVTVDPTQGTKTLPHWLAQPYWRPLPHPTSTLGPLQSVQNQVDEILTTSQPTEVTA